MTTAVRQLFELDKLVDQGAGSDCLPLLRQIQDTLTQTDLEHLISRLNPDTPFSQAQLQAISSEIWQSGGMYISHGRLSCDGLQHIYQQGLASSSRDAALLTATSQTSQQQPAGPCLQVHAIMIKLYALQQTGRAPYPPITAQAFQGLASLEEQVLQSNCSSPAHGTLMLKADGELASEQNGAAGFEQAMAAGRRHFKRRELREAQTAFRAASQLRPNSAKAHMHLGNACFKLLQYDSASASYRITVQVAAGQGAASIVARAHINLGMVQERQGNLHAAADSYRQATAAEETCAEAWKLCGSCLLGLQQLPEAKRMLSEATARDAAYADAWCDLGVVCCGLQDYVQGCAHFEAALALDSRHQRASWNLGLVKLLMHAPEAALQCFSTLSQHASQTEVDAQRLHLLRAAALADLGQPGEAVQALEVAAQLPGASQGTELIRDDLKGYAHVGGKACLASPRFLAIAGKLHARASSKLMPAA